MGRRDGLEKKMAPSSDGAIFQLVLPAPEDRQHQDG